jgi:hypothetical protein
MTARIRSWILLLIALVVLVVGLPKVIRVPGAKAPEFGIGGEWDPSYIEILTGEDDRTVLELQGDASWTLNREYQTNEALVMELIAVIRHMAVRRPVSLVSRGEVDEFFRDQGVVVEIYARDYLICLPLGIRLIPRLRTVRRIEVGPDAPDGDGTAMRIGGQESWYWVHLPGVRSGLRHVFAGAKDRYRSRMLLELDESDIYTVSVEIPGNIEESYSLERDVDGQMVMVVGGDRPIAREMLDTTRLRWFLGAFASLNYERKLSDSEPVDLIKQPELSEPFFRIRLTTRSGDQHELEFFRRPTPPEVIHDPATDVTYDPDRFSLRKNDGDILQAHYYFFSHLLRPASFFLE